MSVFHRTGSAFGAGAPLGASFNIAQNTDSDKAAARTGGVFGRQAGFGAPALQANVMAPASKMQAAPPKSYNTGPSVGERVLAAMAVPVTEMGNLFEARGRSSADAARTVATGEGDQTNAWGRLVKGIPIVGGWLGGLGGADETEAEYFQAAQDAEASVAQTAWEYGRSRFTPDGKNAGQWDPSTGRTELPLIDDPELRGDRAEYFGSGGQRWVTGVADAAFSIYADPLIVAGAAGSTALKASRAVDGLDVAAAANASRLNRVADTTVSATGYKPSRFQSSVERVTDRYYDVLGTPGGLAAAAKDPLLSQTTDAGAVAYMMRRARDIGVDEADSKSLMDTVIYAGAGDRKSLTALKERSEALSLELDMMLAPNLDTAAVSVLSNPTVPHGQALKALDDDALVKRQIAVQQEEIQAELGALQRVMDAGTGGLGVDAVGPVQAGMSAAGITKRPGLVADFMADRSASLARVQKTVATSPGLKPVHLVAGRRIPQTLKLSDDDAYEGFAAATARVENMLRKDKNTAALAKVAGLRDEFVSARAAIDPGLSRTQRHDVLRRFEKLSEDYMVSRHATNGRTPAEVRGVVREIMGRRTAELERLQLSAKQAVDSDTAATMAAEDGIYALTPDLAKSIATSQFQDTVSVIDFKAVDSALKAKYTPGMMVLRDGVWKPTEAFLATFNDLWKFTALLRPLGYPVRVQVDTQARALAHIGVLTHGLTAMRGSGNMLSNLGRVEKSAAELFQRKTLASSRLDDLDTQLANATGKKNIKRLQAERAEQQAILDMTPQAFKAQAGDQFAGTVRRGKTPLKKVQGSSATMDTRTGAFTPSKVTDAYQGVEGYARVHDLTDARASIMGLMDTQRSLLTRDLRSTGRYNLRGFDPQAPGQWNDSYLTAVNHHVRNDHVLNALASGADDESLLTWMRATPEGREYWASMATNKRGDAKWLSPADLLAAQRQHVEALLPTDEIRNRAVHGSLRVEDIDAAFPKGAERPAIPHDLKETIDQGNPLVNGYQKSRAFYFKTVAEIPETVMGRHPFYKDAFQRRIQDLISSTGRESDTLTRVEAQSLRNQADIMARRDVAHVMFDTSKQTNLGYHMRFLMPFYAAWEDTMVKWARIMGERWEVAPLMVKALEAPNKMFEVVDEDGNRILPNGDVVRVDEDGKPYGEVIRHESDPTKGYILLPIPSAIADWAGVDDKVRINKGSLNVIFQGDPFWLPGPGPLMSIPANEAMVRSLPEMFGNNAAWAEHPIGKWLLPFGPTPSGVVDQALPMWAKNLRTSIDQDMSEDRFAQTYAQLLAEEMQAQSVGESAQKSKADTMALVANRARNFYIMKAFGSQSPFSTSPQGRLEWYRQEWNRYIEQYGNEAQDKFLADYPDYFDMTISLSLNEAGIRASDAAMGEATKYRKWIATKPEYGWAYAGATNLGGEFSQGSYAQQKRQVIGPGTDKTFRSTKDPTSAYDDVQVSKGWAEWNKFTTAQNLKLEELGLTLRSKDAGEIRELRDEYLSMMKQNNPAWADAFESGFNGDAAVKFLSHMGTTLKSEPKLAARADMVLLSEYMQSREAMRTVMRELGFKSLDSNAARESGLSDLWAEYTQGLVGDDVGFEQIYNRVLDADDLSAEVVIGGSKT